MSISAAMVQKIGFHLQIYFQFYLNKHRDMIELIWLIALYRLAEIFANFTRCNETAISIILEMHFDRKQDRN